MPDDIDPILEAVEALWAGDIKAEPSGDDFERWRIGDFVLDDATLLRPAERTGLVADDIAQ